MTAKGRLHTPGREVRPPPKRGRRVYLLTCAQNNTALHESAWTNMLALAKHDRAEILVASFTYAAHSRAAAGQKKTSRESHSPVEVWDERLTPYLADASIELAPGLIWCGELQILPTAVNPLSGLESYTRRASSIIPHVTFAVQSVASPKHQGCKFLYTTGAVTLRNYIAKKAGQKASFHHGYGCLIVEVCPDGSWFVRQINADDDGVLYDLDRKIDDGRVTTGHRPEAVVWGDIHARQLHPDMREIAWGPGGILDSLRPKRQILEDVLDFRSQNHHDRADPWKTYRKHVIGTLRVEDEIAECAEFIAEASRPWCETVVVASNHDEAFMRWMRECDHREDPANAEFLLESTLATYKAIRTGDDTHYPVEWAMRRAARAARKHLRRTHFLRRDEDYDVLGTKLDMHGDKGANGAKGSAVSFAKSGMNTITADAHSARLFQGAMIVGVMGSLDQGYNVGLSSWSHTNAIVNPNGTRALFTIWRGRWRA